MSVLVAVAVFELHLPQARSLKDKRRVVKSLTDRLHARYRISVCESDLHDLRQRTQIALAAVTVSEDRAERLLQEVRGIVEESLESQLTRWDEELIEGV